MGSVVVSTNSLTHHLGILRPLDMKLLPLMEISNVKVFDSTIAAYLFVIFITLFNTRGSLANGEIDEEYSQTSPLLLDWASSLPSLAHGDSDSLTLEKREDMFDPGVNYDNNANNSEDDEEDVDLSDDSHPPEVSKRGDSWKFRGGKRGGNVGGWKFRGGKRGNTWKFRGGKRDVLWKLRGGKRSSIDPSFKRGSSWKFRGGKRSAAGGGGSWKFRGGKRPFPQRQLMSY